MYILIFFFLFSFASSQKNPHFVSDRNTIVHLNEWKYTDIANECEVFLKNGSFGGVQISPPSENVVVTTRPWWERYHPVSYNLTTRSGTESEFADMCLRCNTVGIRIYADVVFNHMAAFTGTGTAGNKALSDVKMYPTVPYNPEDFHPSCNITNYLNPEVVRTCEINNSRDLDQSTEYVSGVIVAYLNYLIDLGVAGFRVDSAKYMYPDDLALIFGKLNSLDEKFGFSTGDTAFIYQDVPIFTNDVIGTEEYTGLGTVLEPKFSTEISKVFMGRANLSTLTKWGPDWGFIPNSEDTVVFVDNFYNQRKDEILNYKNLKQYKMALSFMLAHPYGLPAILSSYFFENTDIGPPMDSSENIKSPTFYSDGSCGNGYVCEHRWPQIQNMVEFRSVVEDAEVRDWWTDGEQQVAFSRGDKGFIAFTNGKNLIANIVTQLPAGTYCDIISGKLIEGQCSGKSIVVSNGVVSVSILESDYEGVVAIHILSKI